MWKWCPYTGLPYLIIHYFSNSQCVNKSFFIIGWLFIAGNRLCLFVKQLEDMHLVDSLFEPYSRAVQTVLRSNPPIPSQQPAVDPEVAFAVFAHIYEWISCLIKREGGFKDERVAGSRWRDIPSENGIVDLDLVDVPQIVEGRPIDILEVQQALPVLVDIQSKVDVAHRLH
jgi:hypothetical protein